MQSLFLDYDFSEKLTLELLQYGSKVDIPMGQLAYTFDVDSPYFMILLSGRLRHIVDHPDSSTGSFTLSFYHPPFIAGISSSNFGKNVESLYASEDSTFLRIPCSSFLSLCQKYTELFNLFNSSFGPSDIWLILLNLPQVGFDHPPSVLRERVDNILQSSRLYYVGPDNPLNVDQSDDHLFFNLDRTSDNYGSLIPFSSLSSLHTTSKLDFRIASLPKYLVFDNPPPLIKLSQKSPIILLYLLST